MRRCLVPRAELCVLSNSKNPSIRRFTVGLAVLLCLFISNFAFAQGNGSLGGVVTDPSGALVPGVTITATNTETGVETTTLTNESGAYQFPSLQPGTAYRVSASLPGFQTSTVTNLTLSAGITSRQNFRLSVAAAAGAKVEVSADREGALAATSSTVG